MARMKPTMMDSHGNPGIAGRTKGVEVVLELLVVEAVLTTVIVETEVLTIVIGELVVATDSVGEDVEVVTSETDDVEPRELCTVVLCTVLLCVVLCVVVACWPTTGGLTGSRWKIPDNGVVVPVTPAPTAKPSRGDVK